MLHHTLRKLDKAFCWLYCLEEDKPIPISVRLNCQNKLFIKLALNHNKRQYNEKPLNSYVNQEEPSENSLTAIGIAAGELIASDLVVSFDEVKVNQENKLNEH